MVIDPIDYTAMITISIHDYNMLIRSDKILTALNMAGVDNWEGYSNALEEYFYE